MFYKMSKGDALFLAGIGVFAALGFLIPGLRSAKFAGIALFAWWMAALMFLAPLIALIRMRKP